MMAGHVVEGLGLRLFAEAELEFDAVAALGPFGAGEAEDVDDCGEGLLGFERGGGGFAGNAC